MLALAGSSLVSAQERTALCNNDNVGAPGKLPTLKNTGQSAKTICNCFRSGDKKCIYAAFECFNKNNNTGHELCETAVDAIFNTCAARFKKGYWYTWNGSAGAHYECLAIEGGDEQCKRAFAPRGKKGPDWPPCLKA